MGRRQGDRRSEAAVLQYRVCLTMKILITVVKGENNGLFGQCRLPGQDADHLLRVQGVVRVVTQERHLPGEYFRRSTDAVIGVHTILFSSRNVVVHQNRYAVGCVLEKSQGTEQLQG